MTSKTNKARAAKAAMRKYKKRPNVLHAEHIGYIDYKDVNLLQRFMSDRSKLRARRMNGNTVQQQRDVALAVKNAREMALLPYTKRVAAARAPRRGEEDGGSRSDRPRRGAPNADAGSNESAFVDKYAAAIDAAESSVDAAAVDVEVSAPTTTEEA
jgi:small subunit ribosomal protein S18